MTIYSSNWAKRKERKMSPKDTMLTDFLRATTPHEKREVIKTFNPHYFAFGETLNPRKEIENEEL